MLAKTHTHTHRNLEVFSPSSCPPPPSRRFVLQACVQFHSEHGLPLRSDPGQQTLEELGALRAHTPRLLLFHRLREREKKKKKTTRIKAVNLTENSTRQHGAAVTDITSLKTSISSADVIKLSAHTRRFPACPLALDCFFLIVAAVIKQTEGCVCRSQRTEEQLEDSVSSVFYCSNFTHMWNKSTPNMAL